MRFVVNIFEIYCPTLLRFFGTLRWPYSFYSRRCDSGVPYAKITTILASLIVRIRKTPDNFSHLNLSELLFLLISLSKPIEQVNTIC